MAERHEQELGRIWASTPRRFIAATALLWLGGLLLYIAFATSPALLFWQVFLIVVGLGCLFLLQHMWRSTTHVLILTEEALVEEGGEVIARVEDIVRVDRGMLAMKPSNGFSLFLREKGPRRWRPGLWWRLGRKVAIGGVTSGAQTRPVADIIAMMIAERDM